MNPRLIEYYNRELAYLRELGTEFAAAFPKVAARLALGDNDVADPYVERLLEGFSFLSARIQLKMDAQFPRLSQRVLEMVCPHYLAPTPSMLVAQFQPSAKEGNLQAGFTLPPGSALRAHKLHDEQTACEFRTGGPLTLWPIEMRQARLGGPALDLPLAQVPQAGEAAGHLRLHLGTLGSAQCSDLALEQLWLYIHADDVVASHLQELIHSHTLAIVVHHPQDPGQVWDVLEPQALRAEGLEDEQALLPYSRRAFQGHRLLHEYFAFPQRQRFFSINGLSRGWRRIAHNGVALTVLLRRAAPTLEPQIDASKLLLHCIPAINLFEQATDRIHVSASTHEYHVVPDRARPLDLEVYGVQSVTGHHEGQTEDRHFAQLYTSVHGLRAHEQAYFTMRREPRLFSQRSLRSGPRTQYLGSEVFISLVDQREAPFSDQLKQLSVRTLCTHRDLPLLMRVNHPDGDLVPQESAPIDWIRVIAGPSPPVPAISDGALTWRLISHLSLNYLAMTDLSDEQGAATLRELLQLYLDLGNHQMAGQISAVQSLRIEPITRRLAQHRQLVYGRGVGVHLGMDEPPMAGASPWPLANVLERFFARHVGVNSFTELQLHSRQRGPLARWSPRPGLRPGI
ncbi:type VI secretion system baseplate subunit TssF [Delftia sp. PS-11]|uniref:type VI secretion system baseplate subunit TssF n=1 Tax=Delftia sp. PS-11 TaxID=2767222 RepID=UPI0024553515|nr:type VI secretion system baseplate subunit TssF [Delftia sp. PS-11]KAJ8743928.1 type VI secretion system baseplate subunit TssF [Delftia sp. PS-11]